jgi:uncharacterized protein
MIYIDTSVWIAMFCFEPKANAIQSWIIQQKPASICCSDWLHTELMSALSIKSRRGEISLAALTYLHQTINALRENGSLWATPIAADFQLASQLCASPTTKLRAGDALHLAIAKRLKCKQFFSLDEVLNENASDLGFELTRL